MCLIRNMVKPPWETRSISHLILGRLVPHVQADIILNENEFNRALRSYHRQDPVSEAICLGVHLLGHIHAAQEARGCGWPTDDICSVVYLSSPIRSHLSEPVIDIILNCFEKLNATLKRNKEKPTCFYNVVGVVVIILKAQDSKTSEGDSHSF